MSNAHPRQYSTTYVNVSTAPYARVRTVAHYKTTDTAHHHASIPYDISGATKGYKVKVSVTVHKGNRSDSCSTAFTPR